VTGPAVDLAAVRSARTALAAIVAEHPELTGATARARLAANLPEILAMKPLDPNATGAARTITVRLSADLIAQLEAERDRLAALVPGSSLGLSDAVRSLIHRALATTTTRSFRITNRSTGADFGTVEAGSELDALATMHCDAGYDVAIDETGTELVFASEGDERLCGGLDVWRVQEV